MGPSTASAVADNADKRSIIKGYRPKPCTERLQFHGKHWHESYDPHSGHECPKPPTGAHLREGDSDRRLTDGDRRFTGGELRRGDFRFTEGDLRRWGDRRLIGGDALLTGDPERMRLTGGDRSLPGEPLLAGDLRRTEGSGE